VYETEAVDTHAVVPVNLAQTLTAYDLASAILLLWSKIMLGVAAVGMYMRLGVALEGE
jgi:hypothetical protein